MLIPVCDFDHNSTRPLQKWNKGAGSSFRIQPFAFFSLRWRQYSPSFSGLVAKGPRILGSDGTQNSISTMLILYRPIGNLKPLVDDRKCLAQLLLTNAQWRVGVERIPAHQRIQPLLPEEAPKSCHLL